jgi:hypothetical protein
VIECRLVLQPLARTVVSFLLLYAHMHIRDSMVSRLMQASVLSWHLAFVI